MSKEEGRAIEVLVSVEHIFIEKMVTFQDDKERQIFAQEPAKSQHKFQKLRELDT